jgi:hypothetical protein
MEQFTRFIGMDVHKDTIVIAVTAAGDSGKATPYGTFPNTAAALEKLVRRRPTMSESVGIAGGEGQIPG